MLAHRQPCSAASQPQRPSQAQPVVAAAFAGLAWQPQEQVLPGQGLQGHEVSTAAQEAGFADSAHFSRTCRRMFGIAPAMLVKG